MKLRTTAIAGRLPGILMLAATALAVTACGGGGSYGGGNSTPPPAPQNAAPVLSPFSAVTIDQDTSTGAIAFTVSDDGGAGAVTLTATTSDGAIVPADSIQLGGSGGNRSITLTPAEDATGQVTITVNAQDAQGLATNSTLGVSVRAVERSITAYTNSTFAQDENDMPAQVSGFTFVQDADADNTFDPLLQ
jgi:hypothetical protein